VWINEPEIILLQAPAAFGNFCTVEKQALNKIFWKFKMSALKKVVVNISCMKKAAFNIYFECSLPWNA
jgi:hypothetical protein